MKELIKEKPKHKEPLKAVLKKIEFSIKRKTRLIKPKRKVKKKSNNPNASKNLKPFTKNADKYDDRINRDGAPKKIELPELKEIIAEILSVEEKGSSIVKQIIKSISINATDGDIEAAKFLFDYYYGPVASKIQLNRGLANDDEMKALMVEARAEADKKLKGDND